MEGCRKAKKLRNTVESNLKVYYRNTFKIDFISINLKDYYIAFLKDYFQNYLRFVCEKVDFLFIDSLLCMFLLENNIADQVQKCTSFINNIIKFFNTHKVRVRYRLGPKYF